MNMDLSSFSLTKKSNTNSDNDKIAGLYNIGNTIGKGHYAVVKEAKHAFTGEKVAIKVIDKTKLDAQSREHLFSEVMCMKLVQHPNVVRLYDVIDTVHKLYLILELGDGGDLYDYIMKFENGLPEIKAKRYFRQIVQAIAYCHNLHVVHRDLKPENVVFFEKVELVKLTDFGFSNKFTPGKTLDTSCGSLAYSAPEILLGDAYDAPKIDIWSLGVILYMLVCGHLPFEEANDSETLSKIMDCKYDLPSRLSDSCKNLIRKMLVREPEKRASLEEILSDKWLEYEDESNFALDTFSVPLISQEHLTVEEHVEILTKMSEGNLANVEEIQLILDRHEYSYISATYFLLAERKLKRRYLENYCKMKLLEMEKETQPKKDSSEDQFMFKATNPLSPAVESNEERIRRFSMILEDEEDEAEEEELEAMISLASVREELELTMPKFDNFSSSGITAPHPSRCCSRLSDSIESDNQEVSDINNRFSAFRHQFTNRNRCRSAIYNRRSLIYSSHSLSSIPSSSQLLNDIHEENNSASAATGIITPRTTGHTLFKSNQPPTRLRSLLSPVSNLHLVPRFQRHYSGPGASAISIDDTYLSRHRVSLPMSSQLPAQASSRKRCSYPALFWTGGPCSTLSQSHSSSDISSDTESSVLRGFTECKKVAVPKSFGLKNHLFSTVAKVPAHIVIGTSGNCDLRSISTSSIDSDVSVATASKSTSRQRLRITKPSRSRPSSMGASMEATPYEEFQALIGVGVGGSGLSDIISEEQSLVEGPGWSGALSNSPTVASITVHREICAPIHEEEELIRSRSYIDKDCSRLDASAARDELESLDLTDDDNTSLHRRYPARTRLGPRSTAPVTSNQILSLRSVFSSVDYCRRKSESAEATPAKWSSAVAAAAADRTRVGLKRPAGVSLQAAHSLSSQLTQSNFSLSSFASSLRDSKAMMNLVRGAFELQCLANRVKNDCAGPNRFRRGTACMSATVSGRESRCEYAASVTSLPLGNKPHSPSDDSESRLGLSGRGADESGPGVEQGICNHRADLDSLVDRMRTTDKNTLFPNNSTGNNNSNSHVPKNLFIRAGSNVTRKARFILSCCRPS